MHKNYSEQIQFCTCVHVLSWCVCAHVYMYYFGAYVPMFTYAYECMHMYNARILF